MGKNHKDLEVLLTFKRKAAGITQADQAVITSNGHGLVTGMRVQIKDHSLTYTCTKDGNATEHSYPRPNDPAHHKWIAVHPYTVNTFNVYVGGNTVTFAKLNVVLPSLVSRLSSTTDDTLLLLLLLLLLVNVNPSNNSFN